MQTIDVQFPETWKDVPIGRVIQRKCASPNRLINYKPGYADPGIMPPPAPLAGLGFPLRVVGS